MVLGVLICGFLGSDEGVVRGFCFWERSNQREFGSARARGFLGFCLRFVGASVLVRGFSRMKAGLVRVWVLVFMEGRSRFVDGSSKVLEGGWVGGTGQVFGGGEAVRYVAVGEGGGCLGLGLDILGFRLKAAVRVWGAKVWKGSSLRFQ